MPHAFPDRNEAPLGKSRMALLIYQQALRGTWHKTPPQQIQECVRILSILLQEKKKEGFKDKNAQTSYDSPHTKRIHREYGTLLRYTQDYQKHLSIIRKVLVQEKKIFEGRKVSDRIVSIDRHYVRPIVRGKDKVRRVRCEGQQHTDKCHIVHQTYLVQGIQ